MLARLADMGMDLAEAVHRRALAEAEVGQTDPEGGRVRGGSHADLGLVFSRIARAVRQTLALEARLEADGRVPLVSAAQTGRAAAERRRIKKLKDRVRSHIEDAIAANADGQEAENLLADLDEWLEDPDIDAQLGQRPIGMIIAGICEDLGVDVDLRYFTDAELRLTFPPPGQADKAGADGDAARSSPDFGAPNSGAPNSGAPGSSLDSGRAAKASIYRGGSLVGDIPIDPGGAVDSGGPPLMHAGTGCDPP